MNIAVKMSCKRVFVDDRADTSVVRTILDGAEYVDARRGSLPCDAELVSPLQASAAGDGLTGQMLRRGRAGHWYGAGWTMASPGRAGGLAEMDWRRCGSHRCMEDGRSSCDVSAEAGVRLEGHKSPHHR